jgi:two-component system, NtrC family, nitrogen regulation response regulator GlnG
MSKLLIIDDEPAIIAVLKPGLATMNIEVVTADCAMAGLKQIAAESPDAILLDIFLPDLSGLELFERIHETDDRIPVILMTGMGTTESAITAMMLGAFDYVTKPFSFAQIRDVIQRALEVGQAMRAMQTVDKLPPMELPTESMVGRCPAMQDVYKMIGRLAPQDGIVLIRGDSGTGKELVAQAIYRHSRRKKAPFQAINCAAIPDTLLESELFGHEKGAFTGADRQRVGIFEQCHGGTLFLDEIGDMPPLTQAKVLRVLQNQQFERVGGTQTIRTDVRLIAATHRNLEEMVAAGRFRNDLYFRLNVFTLTIPPLRERIEDLPLLVDHFISRFNREMGRDIRQVSPETMEILTRYPWPGNLRELQSVLRQALLPAVGQILLPEFLPESIRQGGESGTGGSESITGSGIGDWDRFLEERLRGGTKNLYREWTERTELHLLTRVLQRTDGNQLRAAEILGITRRSLRNKLRQLGITIERSVKSADDDEDEDDEPGGDTSAASD